MKNCPTYFFMLFLVLLSIANAQAQKPRTEAVLKVNESAGATEEQFYYIQVSVDRSLKKDVYEKLNSAYPPRVGILMSNKTSKPVAGTASFKNILVAPSEDKSNDRTVFRIYLPKDMDPFHAIDDEGYQVILSDLFVDDDGQPVFRSAPVQKILVAKAKTGFVTCGPSQFSLNYKYTKSNKAQFERAEVLYDYLSSLQKDDKRISRLQIEVDPLTQEKVETLNVRGFGLNPDSRGALGINEVLSVCFETDKGVPGESYDARVHWGADAPRELTDQNVFSDLKGRVIESSPAVFIAKDKAPGLRAVDKDLNIGASLVSSVEDKETANKTIVRERTTRGTLDLRLGFLRDFKRLKVGMKEVDQCGIVKEFTPATNDALGSIKLITEFKIGKGVILENAMKGAAQCLHFTKTDPGTGALLDPQMLPFHDPEATGGTYLVYTPVYLDAKVSTGSIVKETLSLNRVFFGTQAEIHYIPRIGGYATDYRFILQGNHASDRDFKQKEFSGTFRFQPAFGALNHPLDPDNTQPRPRTLCPDCDPPLKRVPIRHGFEFLPSVGFEIGRTYSRKNPAAAIEVSDTVRRLTFQLDMVLNPTDRLRLSTSEIFYIRGESKKDRYHNYFLGDVSYGFGSFAHSTINQSIFFSWERGGQPPFTDADVNVLKFGFRMTSTSLFSRKAF